MRAAFRLFYMWERVNLSSVQHFTARTSHTRTTRARTRIQRNRAIPSGRSSFLTTPFVCTTVDDAFARPRTFAVGFPDVFETRFHTFNHFLFFSWVFVWLYVQSKETGKQIARHCSTVLSATLAPYLPRKNRNTSFETATQPWIRLFPLRTKAGMVNIVSGTPR